MKYAIAFILITASSAAYFHSTRLKATSAAAVKMPAVEISASSPSLASEGVQSAAPDSEAIATRKLLSAMEFYRGASDEKLDQQIAEIGHEIDQADMIEHANRRELDDSGRAKLGEYMLNLDAAQAVKAERLANRLRAHLANPG